MYPLEMKFDDNNIGYIDLSKQGLVLEKQEFMTYDYKNNQVPLKSDFYQLSSTNDYLLKVNKELDVNDIGNYYMLKNLIKLQSMITKVDLPIGYVKNNWYTVGQIIRNYPEAKSLKNICIKEDLESLQKYIYRDEDSLHNLFVVYLEVLELLEELFENNIAYFDVNPGNFVVYNNQIKIIDFERKYIEFEKTKMNEFIVINNYLESLNKLLHAVGINEHYDCILMEQTFPKIKTKMKYFEDNTRKFMHY